MSCVDEWISEEMKRLLIIFISVWSGSTSSREAQDAYSSTCRTLTFSVLALNGLHGTLQNRELLTTFPIVHMQNILRAYKEVGIAVDDGSAQVVAFNNESREFGDVVRKIELVVSVCKSVRGGLEELACALNVKHPKLSDHRDVFLSAANDLQHIENEAIRISRVMVSKEHNIRLQLMSQGSEESGLGILLSRSMDFVLNKSASEADAEMVKRIFKLQALILHGEGSLDMDEVVKLGRRLTDEINKLEGQELERREIMDAWDRLFEQVDGAVPTTTSTTTTTTSTASSFKIGSIDQTGSRKATKKERKSALRKKEKMRLMDEVTEEPENEEQVESEPPQVGEISQPVEVVSRQARVVSGGPKKTLGWTLMDVKETLKPVTTVEPKPVVLGESVPAPDRKTSQPVVPDAVDSGVMEDKSEPAPDRRWTYRTRVFYSRNLKQHPKLDEVLERDETDGIPRWAEAVPESPDKIHTSPDSDQSPDQSLSHEIPVVSAIGRPMVELFLRELHLISMDVCERMRLMDFKCDQALEESTDPITSCYIETARRLVACTQPLMTEVEAATAAAEARALSLPGSPISISNPTIGP